jgi:hypothetical protein
MSGPGHGLRLTREHDGKTQTAVLEFPNIQLRVTLCNLLKGAKISD